MVWTTPAPNSTSRIAWNDIEALPLHAAGLLAVLAIGYGLADAGAALQGMTAKVAMIVGCVGLRSAWIGMHEHPADRRDRAPRDVA